MEPKTVSKTAKKSAITTMGAVIMTAILIGSVAGGAGYVYSTQTDAIVAGIKSENNNLRSQVRASQDETIKLNSQLTMTQNETNRLKSANDRLDSQIKTIEDENGRLKTELSSLQKEVNELKHPTKVSIKIGYNNMSQNFIVPVFAVEKGFFEAEGLKAEAFLLPYQRAFETMKAGDIQFAHLSPANIQGFYAANAQGFHFKLVHFGSTAGTVGGIERPVLGVVVKNELKERVRSFKDLEGLKVGVSSELPALKLTLLVTITRNGGDTQKVVFVDKRNAELLADFRAGALDAVAASAFSTRLLTVEGRVFSLGDPLLALLPKGAVSVNGWYTTEDYLSKNPDVVKKFQRATDRAVTYIRDNPEEWIQWASKKTGQPAEALKLGFTAPNTSFVFERYTDHPALGKRGADAFKAYTLSVNRDVLKLFSEELDTDKIILLPWDDPWS